MDPDMVILSFKILNLQIRQKWLVWKLYRPMKSITLLTAFIRFVSCLRHSHQVRPSNFWLSCLRRKLSAYQSWRKCSNFTRFVKVNTNEIQIDNKTVQLTKTIICSWTTFKIVRSSSVGSGWDSWHTSSQLCLKLSRW